MSYNVISIRAFERQVKRLVKKYPSLRAEIAVLIATLKENPVLGTPLGNNCYKIRISIASKGKGKRGGARVITHFYILDNSIILLSIYDKSEQENISDLSIRELLNSIGL